MPKNIKKKRSLKQTKKLNWKLIVPLVLLVAVLGGFLVFKSFAATTGWKTILSKNEGSIKACKYYAKTGGYILRVSTTRSTTKIVSSAMSAGSGVNSKGDGLTNVRYTSGKKSTWWAGAYQSYDMAAPTRYMAAYLYFNNNTNYYSIPVLISSLPNCQ